MAVCDGVREAGAQLLTAVVWEVFKNNQQISGLIHLRHYFVRHVSKVFLAQLEICLPIHGVQWLVTAVDENVKYGCTALYIWAQSRTDRLSATQRRALGKTQKSISCYHTKFRILLEKVLLMHLFIHHLISLSFSVPSSLHIQIHF